MAAVLLISLTAISSTHNAACAEIPSAKWSKVKIPEEGNLGKWVLASGSDVRHLAQASDGTFYAYADPAGTNQKLFKSTDNGTTWSPTGGVTATVTDIAVVPGTSRVYYATGSSVYISTDGGVTFNRLPPNPGGAGTNNVSITAIAVGKMANYCVVAVATEDTDKDGYGGVYTLDENQFISTWQDTNIGSYDVRAIAASPDFIADRGYVAVASNETDTVLAFRVGNTGWGVNIGMPMMSGMAAKAANIAFPEDYAGSAGSPVFFAIDTGVGKGGAFKVIPGLPTSTVSNLNVGTFPGMNNVDISNIVVSGNSTDAYLIAGSANRAEIYFSRDCGLTWTRGQKDPTGQSVTALLIASDFANTRRAYAGTGGAESGFSCTLNGGISWNQTSLVDTEIMPGGIVDMAISPDFAYDRTLFLLTYGGKYSLWRSQNDGINWQRVFCNVMPGIESLGLVGISPKYGRGSQSVFVAGTFGTSAAIWRSTDGGDVFVYKSIPFPVDVWAVIDDDSMFVGGYDGTNAIVYSTHSGGFILSKPVLAGDQSLRSMVLSPGYEEDGAILIGNAAGGVYFSSDNGTFFKQIGDQLPVSKTGIGIVSVAFDPRFTENKTVYAASSVTSTTNSRERVYRFIVGKSDAWESIDRTLPVGSVLGKMGTSSDGTLYVVNSRTVVSSTGTGGVERCLDPSDARTTTFETVTHGLTDGATLAGLWISTNRLWSFDTTNTQLMTFIDTLTVPVTPLSPQDKAGGLDTNGVYLDWESLSGASKYEWQVDFDGDFASVPTGLEGDTEGSSVRLPALEIATTYYWKARVTAPLSSPWSEKQSFTTKLGSSVVAPELYYPQAGATDIPSAPMFQWSAITGAEQYELLVSPDIDFVTPALVKTGSEGIPATAWKSETGLAYGQTYYWKVRAVGTGSNSAWSSVGIFMTEEEPLSTPAVATAFSLPTTIPIIEKETIRNTTGLPVWVLYGVGVVGLVLVGLLLAILVVLLRRRWSE